MEKWENFFGKGWTEQLREFLNSEEFTKISNSIREIKKSSSYICPKQSEIFRAFLECPWNAIHTVILSNHPYYTTNNKGQPIADGLALSARNADKLPMTLNKIYTEIDMDIYGFAKNDFEPMPDLSYLTHQGVLLLNCSLTREVHKVSIKANYEIWRPFILEVLKKINKGKSEVGILLIGKKAKTFKYLFTNKTFGIYECDHPEDDLNCNWTSNSAIKGLHAYQKTMNNITIKW